MNSRARVLGGDRLMRALRDLPDELRAPVRDELQRGGELVLGEAQRRVPVDTGALRDALALRVRARGLKVQVGLFRNSSAIARTKKALKAQGVMGRGLNRAARALVDMSDTFYARFVEFGTVKMRARPFLLPAAALYRSRIHAAVARAARDSLKKAGRI